MLKKTTDLLLQNLTIMGLILPFGNTKFNLGSAVTPYL